MHQLRPFAPGTPEDRRRHGVGPWIARQTYPVRTSVGPALADLPCRLLGHDWWEVPESLRRGPSNRKGERKRFQCRRCSLLGDFR